MLPIFCNLRIFLSEIQGKPVSLEEAPDSLWFVGRDLKESERSERSVG